MIAVDKAVSLACPFCYSNIVTHSTVSKVAILIWIVSISFSSAFLATSVNGQNVQVSTSTTALQVPVPNTTPKTTLFLLLAPLSLLGAWVPYLCLNIISLGHPCMFKNYSKISIQLPLLFLAGANPWIYGKLPQHSVDLENMCNKIRQKPKQSEFEDVVKIKADDKGDNLQQIREDSTLYGSEGENYRTKLDQSTMDLDEMVN
jgi:hypothetical protein